MVLRFRPPEDQPYRIARIPWPKGAERFHTIVSGTTGSGKTVLISDLVEQIRQRGERCIVYDKMGSYTETFFDDRRDVLLNPLDRRAPRWSPFLEARTARDFDTMAGSADPPPEGRRRSLLDHCGTPALLPRRCRALAARREPQPGAGGPSPQDRVERTRGGHGGAPWPSPSWIPPTRRRHSRCVPC